MEAQIKRLVRPMLAEWYEKRAIQAMFQPLYRLLEVQGTFWRTWSEVYKP